MNIKYDINIYVLYNSTLLHSKFFVFSFGVIVILNIVKLIMYFFVLKIISINVNELEHNKKRPKVLLFLFLVAS